MSYLSCIQLGRNKSVSLEILKTLLEGKAGLRMSAMNLTFSLTEWNKVYFFQIIKKDNL